MVKKILLVDDHPAIRASIGAELLKENIAESVFEAGNSEEGFEQAMTLCPDLIVMDISLYGASGIELTRKILQENPKIKGIANLFGTAGSSKITITPKTTIDQLMTIPGIFPEGDDESDREDSMELAKGILDALGVMPEDGDVDESQTWWPYKDWQDLNKRVDDVVGSGLRLGEEASEYIEFQPGDTSVFKMKITCESMGMKREVNCKCYVKDKKVRYTEWRED